MFTKEELKDYVSNNSYCVFLDEYYKITGNKKRRILILLCKCGEKFEVVLDKFKSQNKKTCNKCSREIGSLKKTKEVDIKEIEDFRNEKYKDKVKVLSFEKKKISGQFRSFINFKYINIPELTNKVFCMRIDRFRSGKNRFNTYSNGEIKIINNVMKTTDEFKSEVDKIRGIGSFDILSEYNGANSDILVRNNVCGHEFTTSARNLISSKRVSCNVCCVSKLEEYTENLLSDMKINFIKQYKFKDCKNKRPLPFDFYLPDYNICIECDGMQHFEPVSHFNGENGFKKRKINDNIKNTYCKNKNITLIRIPYFEKDIKKFLIEKIRYNLNYMETYRVIG